MTAESPFTGARLSSATGSGVSSRPWIAVVNGKLLRARGGALRRWKHERAAESAAHEARAKQATPR